MTTKVASKAVYLRGLPPEVVREAKAAAARRGVTLAGFVAESLTRALEQAEPPSQPAPRAGSSGDLAREQRWFERQRARLLRDYAGQYVAIVEEDVLDHDKDFEALAERVFASQGARDVFMPFVCAERQTLRIRSPRVQRR